MKNNFLVAIFPFLFLLIISGKQNKAFTNAGDSWSGSVDFTETRSGPGIAAYQHQMGARITNDTGTATHSLIIELKDKFKVTCSGQGSSFLEVGVDEDANTYSIFVSIPGCQGTRVYTSGNVESTGEDDTGITVPDQPLGANHNSLRGSFMKRDTTGTTIITTIYRWSVYK
jgi:hypothetical protein